MIAITIRDRYDHARGGLRAGYAPLAPLFVPAAPLVSNLQPLPAHDDYQAWHKRFQTLPPTALSDTLQTRSDRPTGRS